MEETNKKHHWLIVATYNVVALLWVAFWFCLAVITACQRKHLTLVYQSATKIPGGKSLVGIVRERCRSNF